MKHISYIFLYLYLITPFLFPQSRDDLQFSIDSILADEFFNSSIAAVLVYDLTAGEYLYNRYEKMLLHPASNMKVLTSSAGLVFLTPEYTFKTKLAYTGQTINKTLYCDLYIVGGMDPDFTSIDLDTIVNGFISTGVKEISGSLFGDVSIMDSLFWGQGWMWDDDPSTDAPYMTALNINDNAVEIILNAGKTGNPANISTEPKSSFFEIKNNSTTVSNPKEEDISISRDWINRTNKILINGSISADRKGSRFKVNVYNPKLYFLNLLREKLTDNGIKISGTIKFDTLPDFGKVISTIYRRYDSVIVNLNKTSDNLSAEMTLRAMGEKIFGAPADAQKGLRLIDSLISLSGLEPSVYRLVDGSGVSHYNLVSAELLVSILKYIYFKQPELFEILYNSFPIAGVDGTLRSRMKGSPAQNNVHAKTGTLSGVSALSGYIKTDNGNMLTFSMLIQNHVRNNSTAVYFQNEICNLLAKYTGVISH